MRRFIGGGEGMSANGPTPNKGKLLTLSSLTVLLLFAMVLACMMTLAIEWERPRATSISSGLSSFQTTIEDPGTVYPNDLAKRVWDMDLKSGATVEPNTRPGLVFIKGVKVGGTSVSVALDTAARAYGIKVAEVPFELATEFNYSVKSCSELNGAQMYFRHGFKNPWQSECIPNVRFTTVLRDPVAAALSYESFDLNIGYQMDFPIKACEAPQFVEVRTSLMRREIFERLATVTNCIDTPYRKNLTMIHIANELRSFDEGYPGKANTWTATWISGVRRYKELTADSLMDILKNEYFLVGVTERLNEYLVLIALANRWDLSSVYYDRCKAMNDLGISKEEFEYHFPELVAKLEKSSEVLTKAYEWAKREFDEGISQLGGWFQDKVGEFELGLKRYQKLRQERGLTAKDGEGWQEHKYIVGRNDAC